MAVHKRQDRRPPPSVIGTAPTRGPRKRVDTHASIPLCGAASVAAVHLQQQPMPPSATGTARTRGLRSGSKHARRFLRPALGPLALVIPIAVERAPEASHPPISAKLNTDVVAASPSIAGSGPLPAGFGGLERLGEHGVIGL
ncbi:hypothetical protein C8R45DRAFT_1096631 [Mycena sanguinolenta]|nr:hypothetical protein C8R45DRAFT_1096631 [Mycena sanguinolenta]